MTSFRPGEVVLLSFPFASGTQAKNRPAVVLADTGDADVVVARVTTQPHSTHYDVPVHDSTAAGLLAPSVVRAHKVATVEKSLVRRRLGNLAPADWAGVVAAFRAAFLERT